MACKNPSGNSWTSLDGQFQRQGRVAGAGDLHMYLPKPEIPSPTFQSQYPLTGLLPMTIYRSPFQYVEN